MNLRFDQWLSDQQNRQDIIGDFARVPGMQDVPHKASRHKLDEHKNWADIVVSITQPGYIDAFNEAWQEFLLAKLAAKDVLE
ncbi:MAG: hypothetical protein IPL78_12175 [Chloroflexi bacterium]|nr:hypothetical protein [Chloroflexota bacterium]